MSKLSLLLKNTLLFNIVFFSFAITAQEVEEVVVTATKKEESLQDVAIAVQAFTSEDIADQLIYDMDDIAEQVPGLGVGKSVGSGSAYTIRGIGSFGVGAANISSVVTASNGHSVNDSVFNGIGMFDLERIEVLKGPQGTLNGRNATTGVINFVTARPTNEVGGSVDVTVGNYNQKRINSVVNLPLGDSVNTRLALVSNYRDGYMKNLELNTKYDDRNEQALRLSVDWEIGDTMMLKLTSQYQTADDNRPQEQLSFCTQDQFYGCSPFERGTANQIADTRGHYTGILNLLSHLDAGAISNSYADSKVSDNPFRETYLDRDPTHEQDTAFTTLEFVKEFDNYTFIAKYSYDTREFHQMNDNDGTVGTKTFPGLLKLLNPTAPDVAAEQDFLHFSEFVDTDRTYDFSDVYSNDQQFEINIISDFEGPFNYTFGLYTYDGRNDNNYSVQTAGGSFLSNFGKHPYNAIFQTLGLPDMSAYGGIEFNQALAGAAAGGFTPQLMCPIVGSWTVPLAPGVMGDVCAVFGIGGPGMLQYNTPVEISGVLQDSNVRTKTNSIFSEFYFELSEVTKLTLGLRYDDQSVANNAIACLTASQCGSPTNSWLTGTGPQTGTYERDNNTSPRIGVQEDEFLSYKIALQHDFADDIMMYLSFATASKPGGFNPGLASNSVPFQFDKEESETLDLGFRSILANGAILLNMNLYMDTRNGMQVGAIKDTSAVNWNIDAEIKGFEGNMVAFLSDTTRLDLNWLLTDSEVLSSSDKLIDPLNVANATGIEAYFGAVDPSGTGAITAAMMDNGTMVFKSAGFVCLALAAPLSGIPCTNDGVAQDVSGNRVPAQANSSFSLALTQTINLSESTIDVRLSKKYVGQMYADIWNTNRANISGRSNTDLLVSYQKNAEDWYLNFFVKNIDDSRDIFYLRSGSNFQGGNLYGSITEPRTFGVQFGTKF
jgi:outer membrane receptor protein involved in Fe transport